MLRKKKMARPEPLIVEHFYQLDFATSSGFQLHQPRNTYKIHLAVGLLRIQNVCLVL